METKFNTAWFVKEVSSNSATPQIRAEPKLSVKFPRKILRPEVNIFKFK